MSNHASDPLSFLQNMWGNNGFALPGMVTPTLDTDELEKRIKELKTVEGWLRTNLSMLSMTIQNLEMQRTTISAVKTMGQMMSDNQPSHDAGGDNPSFAQAAMWPWAMMKQMQETMQQAAENAQQAAQESQATQAAEATKASATRRKKTP